jgi:hypothetical protein
MSADAALMPWEMSHRAASRSRIIADRHYNRQKVGTLQFVPPGRCLVLHAATPTGKALWITSWPFAEFVKHEWAGAWTCSAFRNEGAGVASSLITDALSATRAYFGEPPPLGMITFLDRSKVRPIRVRGADVWGWTWLKAGFQIVGETKGGLLALQIEPTGMPTARYAINGQPNLWSKEA